MTDSLDREMVKTSERPIKQHHIRVPLKENMKIAGKIRGLPVVWKIDTGAKRTFITSKDFKRIPYHQRPGLKSSRHKFIAANGELIECDGETTILMEFKGVEI